MTWHAYVAFAETALNAISAIAAVLSAWSWVAAARVPLPNITRGTNFDGTGAFPEALDKQARLAVRAHHVAAGLRIRLDQRARRRSQSRVRRECRPTRRDRRAARRDAGDRASCATQG